MAVKKSPVVAARAKPVNKPAVAATVAEKALEKTSTKAPVKASTKAPEKVSAKATVKSANVAPAKAPTRSKAAAKEVEIKPVVEVIVEKHKKAKLVRDSFTMPESEYAALGAVKKACLKAGVEVKKSQLLRIGVALLSKTEVPALKKLIAALAPLKAGRPKNEK
ncbi:hypothetical protein ACO0LG_02875 [Undibacterium sp. Ji42W]